MKSIGEASTQPIPIEEINTVIIAANIRITPRIVVTIPFLMFCTEIINSPILFFSSDNKGMLDVSPYPDEVFYLFLLYHP